MQKITAPVPNPFFAAALAEVPRLLGQIDRNPLSPTYGSCDRAFWHYRTNDISSMRYQEAALTLALLYANPFEGNQYYHDPRILSWANAAIRFACARQHTDGSFDEWYLNEGSFVCTAFVSSALSEAALVLGDDLEDRDRLVVAMKKSGAWLAAHTETLVVNQLAGATLALHNLYRLTSDRTYREAAEGKCARLLSLQHPEGWWNEYGGPDIGYLSLTIDYLSRYAEQSGDVRVHDALERAVVFLAHFIHPDGTAGGEYMARNTEYLIPSGFVRAARYSESARTIAARVAGLLTEEKGITPRSLDDRYTCYILYNWIEAGSAWEDLAHKPIPSVTALRNTDTVFFSGAGLFVGGDDRYQIFGNVKKGGSVRLYTRDSVLIDSGVNVRRDGSVYAGNVLRPDTWGAYDASAATFHASGALIRVRAPLLTTGRAIALKTVQWAFGRVPAFQKFLKRALRVASVMRPGASSDLRYERVITLGADTVTITDTLNAALSRDALVVGEANIYALVPSSRYAATGVPPKILHPQSERYEVTDQTTRLTRVFAV